MKLSIIINDFIKTHGNKYDYSKVKYINAHNKVTITCKIHGDFSQNPQSHKKGGICPECYNEREIVSIIPINEIINRFKLKHRDRYDYSKVIYKNTHRKVKIICKDHGVFEQSVLLPDLKHSYTTFLHKLLHHLNFYFP